MDLTQIIVASLGLIGTVIAALIAYHVVPWLKSNNLYDITVSEQYPLNQNDEVQYGFIDAIRKIYYSLFLNILINYKLFIGVIKT